MISADDIHREDMKDPAYRRAYRLDWLWNQLQILWLRLRNRRRSQGGPAGIEGR